MHRYLGTLWRTSMRTLFRERDTERILEQFESLPTVMPYCISRTPHPIYSIGRYDTPLWHALIYEIKSYRNAHAIQLAARPLADVLASHVRDVTDAPCYILPIPLTPARQRARGYNQITCLLEAAVRYAPHLAPYVRTDILYRTAQRSEQKTLNRARREANIAGVFEVPQNKCDILAHAHIVIVDDVCATGATVRDAARACLEAGASGIAIIVLCNS